MVARVCRWVCVILIVGVVVATADMVHGAPQKKRPKPKPPAAPKTAHDSDETKDKPAIESAKLPPALYRGKIVSEPNEARIFRVAVEYQRVRVKRGKEAEYDKLRLASLKHKARSKGSETRAVARAQMTPFRGNAAPLPDRREISQSLGLSVSSAVMARGEKEWMNELLEKVSDTQIVVFHAAPKIRVRVLNPSERQHATESDASDKWLDSIQSDSRNEADRTKKTSEKAPLPGYEGKSTDLKVGQRVLLRLSRPATLPPGSLYTDFVTLIVVEEEPKT